MAITAAFQTPLTLLSPRDLITEAWAVAVYQASNALYEVLWDVAAPGSGAQTWQGHDHTPQGGGAPIHRGQQWGACSLTGLKTLTFGSRGEILKLTGMGVRPTMILHGSPGLHANALYTCWIAYAAKNSDRFTLEVPDVSGGVTTSTLTNPYNIDLEVGDGEGTKIHWAQFFMPVVRAGWWLERDLQIRCGTYDSSNKPVVTIYALQVDELRSILDPVGKEELVHPTSTGNTIIVAFPRMDDALVAVDEWLDAYALKQLYSFQNALYEGTEELRAPGASSQTCRGHDHEAGSYGGRAIARGGCYTGTLCGGTYLYRLAHTGSSAWLAWDLDDGANRRSLASVGMAIFWVGPGLSSSGNPPTNPPYLTARLWVEWDAGASTPQFDFRVKHLATGNYSAVTSPSAVSTFSGWIEIDKIPCQGDATNQLQFEVRQDQASTINVDLWHFSVHEVPGQGGRTNPGTKPALAAGAS